MPKSTQKYTKLQPKRVIAAIKGSRGLKTEIARRLQCSYSQLCKVLSGGSGKGTEWNNVRREYATELERVGDLAEGTIYDALEQRADIGVAARTALQYAKLKLGKRGYKETTHNVVTGKDGNAVEVNVNQHLLPIDELDLPLDVKKQILKAMEKREQEILSQQPEEE